MTGGVGGGGGRGRKGCPLLRQGSCHLCQSSRHGRLSAQHKGDRDSQCTLVINKGTLGEKRERVNLPLDENGVSNTSLAAVMEFGIETHRSGGWGGGAGGGVRSLFPSRVNSPLIPLSLLQFEFYAMHIICTVCNGWRSSHTCVQISETNGTNLQL